MVTVLLAAFNGEKYIAAQLDSIINQTYRNIKIIVRDDGSTDSTPDIIKHYCEVYPDIISLCPTNEPTGSAAGNFFKLLEMHRDNYIMFCDQDDIWLPNKIELTLNAMKNAEAQNPNLPILVHTDLIVADSKLQRISNSFMKFQKLSPNRYELNHMLMQNNITGCTVMINQELHEKLFVYPEGCAMHDWWIGIVAAAFGKIVFLSTPTILYRQHSGNEVGAKDAGSLLFLISKLKNIKKIKDIYAKIFYQAKFLLDNYQDQLNYKQKRLLSAVADIPNMGKLKKIKTIKKFGLQKNTPLRTILQYFLI